MQEIYFYDGISKISVIIAIVICMKDILKNCNLCPRNCFVDRSLTTGVCGMKDKLVIARASLHMWEEPCISSDTGSGTIFFTGCNLKCIFCQNHEISTTLIGKEVTTEEFAKICLNLQKQGANNINLVTPTHFVPLIIEGIKLAKEKGLTLPIVYNTSSYENVETIKMLDGIVDIYLPDLKYYDDTYAMDQNACSSPQLIVWRGSEEVCRGASERWWRAVLHQLKEYSLSEKQVYDKYSLACELAMQDECEMVQWVDQKLCHIWMRSLPKDWADLKGNSGIFMEYRVENQEALREIDCEKLQTLLVLGIEHDYLQQMVSSYSMKGILRIAAFGQALEMDLIWDGQDLTQKLTESDFFKWSEIYESHVMLVDDRNQSMTYREARLFGEEYFNQVTARSLLMMVTENTIGSVLTYIHALRHNLVPMLLDKKTEKSRLAVIAEKYRPEYVAVPENLEWQPGTKYREKWHTLGYIFYNRDDGEKEEKGKLHRDLALLLSTSGSTGSPKFVKISKLNLQSNTRAIASYLHITENDRPITTLPMSYTYGLSIINSHVYMGATLLLTEYSVMEQTFWNFFLHQQATTFGGVPYTYQMLKFIGFQNMVLPSLKTMTQAGGKLPVELQKIFSAYAKKNHQAFIVMYGQTEATARMAYLPWKAAEQKMGSIGIAIPGGHFALEDGNSGVILESNKTGELIYYGRNVTMGYAVNRESLAAGDENHGRLVTGDLAYRDEEGFYYITGRKKRFVKLLGNRVSLDETEEMLSREFMDMTFACTGTDEQMKVFYVGNRQGDMAISRFLSKKLHLFKKNFVICKIDSIPRNASGKILYEQLKSC